MLILLHATSQFNKQYLSQNITFCMLSIESKMDARPENTNDTQLRRISGPNLQTRCSFLLAKNCKCLTKLLQFCITSFVNDSKLLYFSHARRAQARIHASKVCLFHSKSSVVCMHISLNYPTETWNTVPFNRKQSCLNATVVCQLNTVDSSYLRHHFVIRKSKFLPLRSRTQRLSPQNPHLPPSAISLIAPTDLSSPSPKSPI